MSLLDVLADQALLSEEKTADESLFEFSVVDATEQEVRDQIHARVGLWLKNPSTIEPDAFNQNYRHLLPSGFTFDPNVVESIRVRVNDNETSFRIIPFERTGMQVYYNR